MDHSPTWDPRFLLEALSRDVTYCNRHQVPLTLVLAEIDDLDRLDERLGRGAREVVLSRVARLLQASIRGEDLLARSEAGAFAVVLRACDTRHGLSFAERIRAKVAAAPIDSGAGEVDVTVSVGIAELGPEVCAPRALIDAADRNLRRAK